MRKSFRYLVNFGLLFSTFALASNTDIDLTGKVRYYAAGTQTGVQVDVVNKGHHPAFGPNVEVRIKDRNGNLITEQFGLKLYQYSGGTATTPNTVNSNQQGYIALRLPAGVSLFNGENLQVRVRGEGQANFGTDQRKAIACRKGTPGCL